MKKRWELIVSPFLFVLLIATVVIWPWMRRIDLVDPWFGLLARINATLWFLVLWWSSHHLLFQLAALGKRTAAPPLPKAGKTRFAILYLTCDDFQAHACASCLQQNYPRELFRVLICDDSSTTEYKQLIDRFVLDHGLIEPLRRNSREGYKAGNLNHALRNSVLNEEEWVVIADADQVFPDDFLTRLAGIVWNLPKEVAFVQGGHDPFHEKDGGTLFQEILGTEIPMFYDRDLGVRGQFGFVPFLGHGAAVRKKAWEQVGGFREVVSEDYAFSLQVSGAGLTGLFVEDLRSKEAFPRDYSAFLVRLKKFSGGSAELLRTAVFPFMQSSAPWVEKVDFGMLLLWYLLMPLVVLNGFLSAYVCHRWWSLGIGALHPILPYLFLGMFLFFVPVMVSVTGSYRKAGLYWFWATAIHSASLPYASWNFVIHLWKAPGFERTPKGKEEARVAWPAQLATLLLGAAACALSWKWLSPFSPVLMAYGTAFLSFPLLLRVTGTGLAGRLARLVVWVPGAFFLLALYAMWTWGRL